MAVSATYCTHRDLEDIFPNVNDYDSKEPVYGWEDEGTSNLYEAQNPGLVTQLFKNGESLGDAEANKAAVNSNDKWFYDSTNDVVYFYHSSTNPIDLLMEAGEDYSTLITRIMKNASRYFDSRVDATLPRDQWKDKEGNYDYLIVRTVSIIAVAFLLKAYDSNNPMLEKFEEEYNMNLALLNGGQARLSHQNSADSSKGILREVSVSGAIRPIDTRGYWSGTYDLLKVKITTAGAIGIATYSVWTKDSDGLKNNQVVTDKKINGDFQSLAGGLEIRFAGSTDASEATENDEWEVEVHGVGEVVENPVVRAVKMTRGWKTHRRV
tara:strand:+ start:109 stop:1077 length:969 start_codon:yes stop_codon:yes gene_type:complete